MHLWCLFETNRSDVPVTLDLVTRPLSFILTCLSTFWQIVLFSIMTIIDLWNISWLPASRSLPVSSTAHVATWSILRDMVCTLEIFCSKDATNPAQFLYFDSLHSINHLLQPLWRIAQAERAGYTVAFQKSTTPLPTLWTCYMEVQYTPDMFPPKSLSI